MKKLLHLLGLCLLCACASAQDYLSPCDVAISPDGQTLYVAAATGHQLLFFDVATTSVVRRVALPDAASGVVPSADGQTLWVTGGGYNGFVWPVDVASGRLGSPIPVGHTPMAPVLSPDGNTLYVCNQFDNDVGLVDLRSGKMTARVPVLREPVAADVSPDGRQLFVANLLPDGPADCEYVAAKVSVIDTEARTVRHIPLLNGAEGVRGIKVSPDGNYVFASHLVARYLVPLTQLERGWVSTDGLSVIRVADSSLHYTVLLDDVDRGFANPWALGFSGDGRTLVVSSAGNHELCLIDLPAMLDRVEEEAAKRVAGAAHLDRQNNLSFLSSIRKRFKLQGNGPRAIAMAGQVAFVATYFSDALEAVDFSNRERILSASHPLGPALPPTPERQGEIHFNDAALCFQNWLSCATCHPDARVDALNWDLLNDGMGNPKNARSMLLAHQTPRAMTLGVRANAEVAVRAGIRHIQFAVRPESDAVAIDAYLKSLAPVPSPHLENGRLSASAQRGQGVFAEAGCIGCHPPPLYTDLALRDVGTAKGADAGRPVDTPTLVEVWRTAPYLHDGRAATVAEVITMHNHGDRRGKTSSLAAEQINDLVEFVLSIPPGDG